MHFRIVFSALLLTALNAEAQGMRQVPIKPYVPDATPSADYFENQREELSGSGPYGSFKLVYDRDSTKRTQLRFISPEPMSVRVTEGPVEVLRDTIPSKLDAKPGRKYRVQIINGKDVVFDQSFEAREGMVGQLQMTLVGKPVVSAPPPAPPPVPTPTRPSPIYPAASGKRECMSTAVMDQFTGLIRGTANVDDKLWYVRDLTRRGNYYFCVSQVFTTLKLLPSPKEQLDALTSIAPLVVDRQNEFKIPALFKTDAEKDQARRILATAR